ncbi:NAD-dependent epimerase/dehydratase family protein [Polyangium sp. y55x31]|uniref:NAD-dependent epimerase/dehydratase family protein n=1 Tax=Polyangium sp. y55x31 TaxID=3042688 RepID=UPI0024824231|nr:NAD-dependent epimerase/dehydratase family protein [Polyangium sp. y55x31]MDI1483863.1 NAD-dependent epimerase/dehydratase family protein [Polyangium sp. y55x31]
MNVVVTGATGHVGANLTRALVERGDRVRVLYRHAPPRSLDGIDCERITGDVRDSDTVDRAVQGAELVYHCAAKISLESVDPEVETINVDGVRNITNACLRHGVRRLVHFSSIHAFATEPASEVLDEKRPLITDQRQPPYDRSKAAGHRVVLSAVEKGLDAVVLHPAAVLGPHDYMPSRMGRVLLSLARGRMPGLVEGGFSWVDVRDIVAAALAADTRGRRGENYLLSGHWLSFAELAAVAGEVTGRRPPRLTTPMWLARAVAPAAGGIAKLLRVDPLFNSVSLHALRIHRYTSHKKAETELGFTPRSTKETLEATYAWFREVGMLPR